MPFKLQSIEGLTYVGILIKVCLPTVLSKHTLESSVFENVLTQLSNKYAHVCSALYTLKLHKLNLIAYLQKCDAWFKVVKK